MQMSRVEDAYTSIRRLNTVSQLNERRLTRSTRAFRMAKDVRMAAVLDM
jgi:hypothetical protein